MRLIPSILSMLAAATIAQPALAAVTFSASQGTRAAAATFDIVAGKLQVVLDNTSGADSLVPTDILTALFFNVSSGAGSLTAFSATTNGVTYLNGAQANATNTNVGGEWAYAGVSSGSLAGTNAGISSTGLNLFGDGNFNGPNLSGPVAIDGLQYGITSTGDNLATDNGGLANNEITKHSVTFLLNIAQGFSLSNISNVSFQYGTGLTEPRISPGCIVNCNNQTPEPGTLALAGLGLLAAIGVRRRSA